jgi:broad specificity phosphatase PhoE
MLVLVRHGRTAWNAERRFVGRTDVDLDEHGEAQARAVGAVLGDVRALYTSPLRRARRTAELLGTGLEPVVDDAFVELDYGELEGVRLDDVSPATWRTLRDDHDTPLPGGESFADVHARVAAALDALFADRDGAARRDGAHVVVVSHVSPIKAAVAWALGMGPEIASRLRLDNGSITRIAQGPFGPVLASFNEQPVVSLR